jgi:hypothetical protein
MKKKTIIYILAVLFLLFIVFSVYWVLYLRKAHSTFDDYYAFRGCTELLEKTDSYGLCKLKSGETIKIVKFNDKWYLDGDLPVCDFGFCF